MESRDEQVTSGNVEKGTINIIHDGEGSIYGFTQDERKGCEMADKLGGICSPIEELTEVHEVFSIRVYKSGRVDKDSSFNVKPKDRFHQSYTSVLAQGASYERCYEILKENGYEVAHSD